MNKLALPYTLIGTSKADELTKKLNASLQSIYAGWFSQDHKFRFTITHINQRLNIDITKWSIHANSKESWLAFKPDSQTETWLISEMLSSDGYTIPKMTTFTNMIFHDFIESNISAIYSLANMVSLKGNSKQEIDTRLGSGAIIGNMSNGVVTLPIAIGGDLVQAICGSRTELAKNSKANELSKREQTILNSELSLKILAGKAVMSIDDITKIEIGDVVLLDSKLEDSFSAYTSSGNFLAQIQLGKRANQKAIQLIE